MKKIKLRNPLLVCASGLLFGALPLWRGVPVWGDTLFHAMWYTNFSAQLLAGDLYPRWLLNLNGGLGSPVFFFYAPLPYYITTLFKPLMPGGIYGTLHLGASVALAVIASGLAAYLWLKEIAGREAATVAAVLYMLMPYHLAVDVYTRDAFAEVWAFVWMPLMLYSVRRLAGGASKFALTGLALSYAALITTHLPTTLIFSLVPPCYAFFACEPQGRRRRSALLAACGMLLGAGLASIYLLPAMLNQRFVSLADLLPEHYNTRWLQLTNFDLTLVAGRATIAFLLTVGVVVCACVLARRDGAANDSAFKRVRAFWIITAAACVLLMFPTGDFVWRLAKPLQTIQFPWRFNAVLCVAAAALIAQAPGTLRRGRRYDAVRLSALLVGCALVLGWVVFTVQVARKEFPSLRRGSPAGMDAAYFKRLEQGRDAPEYRPATAASTQAGDFENLLSRICHDEGGRIARACAVEGTGAVTVERWQPRDIALRVETEGGVALNVSQFYYPGWAAYLDGRRHPLAPSAPDGLLHLDVPAGAHQINLRLRHTAAEDAGIILSAASLVALILCLIAQKYFEGKRRIRVPPTV
ncbi:MAG TPA: 6-pyruvoyl-tetrahydropterin synthase-related protein [Pyrinomonadaceae bacterium]|nr:6-pyruvoyl-tetrahydropterin synthase-related protein [Pyrinomonadaceae bacterium]